VASCISQQSLTVAKLLVDKVNPFFGIPRLILSDRPSVKNYAHHPLPYNGNSSRKRMFANLRVAIHEYFLAEFSFVSLIYSSSEVKV